MRVPLWLIARWKRPLESGEARLAITAVPPPDCPKIVTLPASPPNAAMFVCTQRSASCSSMIP
jgi:hypothetical protein